MKKELLLPVNIAGIEFKNPFYVASGPTTRTVNQLVAIEKAGWAAASIKLSIDPAPYINRYPRYKVFDQYGALAFTAEKRLRAEEGVKLVSDAKKHLDELILMANITYAGDDGVEGWVRLAERFSSAGADIIELNMCCPNMSYNVETTSGDIDAGSMRTGASLGRQADAVAEIVSAIKKRVGIPLFVKLTPEGGEIAIVAKAIWDAGADAVGGTGNRLGMPPINLESPAEACYHLQKEISMSCYCGAWLKPLAQRDTYEMRNHCGDKMPIMATGGIKNANDAIEMAMCGGDLMGICTETLMRGYDFIEDVIVETKSWLSAHGYDSLGQVRDKIVAEVKSAPELTLYAGYAKVKDNGQTAPCTAVCPKKIPIQAVLKNVSEKKFARAYELIPGSEYCERCVAPCETACVKGRVAQGISIRAVIAQLRSMAVSEGITIIAKPDSTKKSGSVAKAMDILANRKINGAEKIYRSISDQATAILEASRCLRCGCGEGCSLCTDICCEFAIALNSDGCIEIDRDKCVACGMCFNLCPNKNIEIISSGKVI